ncbi:MAG: transposase [Thermodesulfobacteriota bacterium]|nr:transposase [Thermodesulfobacteriota bacterium]
MPRAARQLVDGGIYHLINRGNAQQTVFKKEQDFQAFTDLLLQMCNDFNIDLYAWCLMTNHYHLVVRPHKAELLSKGIHWFQSTHVRRYHRHYGSSGHLWQGRYKSFSIDDSDQLLTVIRYVEANPARAGMVDSAVDWLWSSHRHRVGTGSAGACPLSSALPVDLPQPWTAYVDTPMTDLEIYKMRNGNR